MEADPELGQAHLAYGISLLFRNKDQVNGPKEILLSQTVKFPYEAGLRELPAVSEAAFLVKDTAVLKLMIQRYSQLGTTNDFLAYYTDFGRRLTAAGYNDLLEEFYRALPQTFVNKVREQVALGGTASPVNVEPVTIETAPVVATASQR